MKTSIKIFKIFDIPIELDFSFLILIISIYFLAFLELISLELAVLITLIFVTVVIHELAHSYVARRFGVKIEKILLLPIGGIAKMEEIPRVPRQELLISIAGPSTNLIIAATLYGIGSMGIFPHAITEFIANFILVNVVLALFNLIPAFPMDGGRILRALLAEKMSYLRSTEVAANLGKFLAILMAMAGIFFNLFLILIALFIYIGAEQEYRLVFISSLLEGVKVSDVMTPDPITLKPSSTVREALETVFKYKHMGYPVTENGELKGIVTFHDLSSADENTPVSEVMTEDVITVDINDDALIALEKLTSHDLGRLPVVKEGKLVGIISKTDLIRTLDIMRRTKT